MDLVKPFITMVTSMKESLSRGRDAETAATGLIGFISIVVNGSITVSGEKANYTKMKKFFSRDSSKKD